MKRLMILAGLTLGACGSQHAQNLSGRVLRAMQYYDLESVKKQVENDSCWLLVDSAGNYRKVGEFALARAFLDVAEPQNPDDTPSQELSACYPVRERAHLLFDEAEASEMVYGGVRDRLFYQKVIQQYEEALGYLQKSKMGNKELEAHMRERIMIREKVYLRAVQEQEDRRTWRRSW